MLEIRYNMVTNVVTGWCGDSKQFGFLKDRGDEAIVIVDIPLPPKPNSAYLFDEATATLSDNPDYIEPKPPRDLLVEIDDLKARLTALEPKEV